MSTQQNIAESDLTIGIPAAIKASERRPKA
jgi:hypothetical protein